MLEGAENLIEIGMRLDPKQEVHSLSTYPHSPSLASFYLAVPFVNDARRCSSTQSTGLFLMDDGSLDPELVLLVLCITEYSRRKPNA